MRRGSRPGGRARSRGERNAGISSLEKLMQDAEAKPMKKTNTAVERTVIQGVGGQHR
jgi:hypothetical protein